MVLELNGDDLAQLNSRRRSFRLYHRVTRGRALGAAAGLVAPSMEVSRLPGVAKFGTGSPVAIISNGIDLGLYEEYAPPSADRPVVGFTYTSSGPWTGVDDVIALAAVLRNVQFSIVGPKPRVRLPTNVIAHGYLTGADYDRVVQTFDVGIGSLNLFNAGLEEASTLKVRGYLAHGIPAVIGHRDSDFPDGADFLLRVPNRAAGIVSCADEVRRFIARWRGLRVNRADVAHLDSRVKENVRLEFLESIVRRAHQP